MQDRLLDESPVPNPTLAIAAALDAVERSLRHATAAFAGRRSLHAGLALECLYMARASLRLARTMVTQPTAYDPRRDVKALAERVSEIALIANVAQAIQRHDERDACDSAE
jgi:hypothetical protein